MQLLGDLMQPLYSRLIKLCSSFMLTQMVSEPTHEMSESIPALHAVHDLQSKAHVLFSRDR